jgi:hypothetical protein
MWSRSQSCTPLVTCGSGQSLLLLLLLLLLLRQAAAAARHAEQ